MIKHNYNEIINNPIRQLEYTLFMLGYNFNYVQNIFCMRNLSDGVQYYGEVHHSYWNSFIHTLFMPFTMFGMYLWIPALFKLNETNALELKWRIMLFYIGLYSRISLFNTFVIIGLYYFPYTYSTRIYNGLYKYGFFNALLIDEYYLQNIKIINNGKKCLIYGIVISFTSLFIQETIGHYFGGDEPSRLVAVPNAILYAAFYSVSHLFQLRQ
jgi:hypothetical protein